jgi:membrane protein DedA with SNARE-associated domain
MQGPALPDLSMDFESLRDTVVEFVRDNQAWAPFVVGFLAFGESLAFLSLLFPATVLLVAIGAMIETTGLSFWSIWLGAALGAWLGDWLSYEIGRYFEDRAHHVWPLNRYKEAIARGEAFTRKYGVLAIFFGKFFGPLRAFVPLAAGIFEMPRASFQIADITAAMVWAFVLLKFGDVVGEAVTWLVRFFQF